MISSIPVTRASSRRTEIGAWTLASLVSLLAFIAWGSSYKWYLWPLSPYQLFPLLGLVAFSLMWSHYLMGAFLRAKGLDSKVLDNFFRWTGYVVLGLICLHPGLLIYARFRDGFGLPPHSYESYVAPQFAWVTLLGTASLCVFLAFELHRFFGERSWWHFVTDASDAAMLAIGYHALVLGTSLQASWFRTVWWFYVLSLIVVLLYKYWMRLRPSKADS